MNDSIQKIVKYFAALTEQPFRYRSIWITPMPLKVSPLLLRDFSCPPYCGACCPVFTLDYISEESCPNTVIERQAPINDGKRIYTDFQGGNTSRHCRFVKPEDARCAIYEMRPFSCDFELIRVFQYKDHYRLTQQPFGRGWNLTRAYDGRKGALCELYYSKNGVDEVVRKLRRLEQWMNYFGITYNRVEKVIKGIPCLKRGEFLRFSIRGGLWDG